MHELDYTDRVFLEACRGAPRGELELVTVREGREVEFGAAMEAHAESMVRRGYLERVSIGGSKSRLQGAAIRVTYRATEAAHALLAAAQRAEQQRPH